MKTGLLILQAFVLAIFCSALVAAQPAPSTESAAKRFFEAVKKNDVDRVRRLLEKTPALISVRNELAWTPLHAAVDADQDKIVELLLAKNADVNAKDDDGDTPLLVAVTGSKIGSAELLLANKADVNAGNLAGNTPLHLARSKEMAALLLTKGGNIEARNNDGLTPLHTAVKDDTAEVAEFLLSRDAKVNAKDNEGNTPLHVQIESIDDHEWISEITELLLANKADVSVKNNEGATPLTIAIKRKNEGAIQLLRRPAKEDNSQALPVKVLGSLANRRQIVNRYVLIQKGLNEAELLTLARDLHRLEPKTYFWMLDDDARAEQLLKALEDYAAGRPDDFPTDWVREHMIANVQEYLGPGTTRSWGLARGIGSDKIADIP